VQREGGKKFTGGGVGVGPFESPLEGGGETQGKICANWGKGNPRGVCLQKRDKKGSHVSGRREREREIKKRGLVELDREIKREAKRNRRDGGNRAWVGEGRL